MPIDTTFSVVIPVYNRASTVMDTLESVRNQTYGRFQCYVVDDGSRDSEELKAVVESLRDDRFIYVWQENGGGGAARNTGIAAATGDFISLLDSDDQFLPEKLEKVAAAIQENPEVDVFAHLARMERGDGVSIVRPRRLPRENESVAEMMFCDREFMQTSTLVVRSALAKEVGFDPTLKKAQDVDFMIRLERAGAVLKCLPEVLSIWNDAPAGNRVGAPRKPDNVMKWYESQKPLLPKKTRYAFEATYLSYEISRTKPLLALFYIARASMTGSVGMKMTGLSAMRAFLDQKHYRPLVDRMIKMSSRSGDQSKRG